MGLRHVLSIWAGNADFMAWNLTLALVPVVIGAVLFRRPRTSPSPCVWPRWFSSCAWI